MNQHAVNLTDWFAWTRPDTGRVHKVKIKSMSPHSVLVRLDYLNQGKFVQLSDLETMDELAERLGRVPVFKNGKLL